MSRHSLGKGALAGLLVALAIGRAAAATAGVEACAAAYEQAQEQRQRGAFGEARGRLSACAAATCPAFIVKDCRRWLDEVDVAQPTVVLAVRLAGRDLERVTVRSDGRVLAQRLDGRALPLDPGKHALSFEAEGAVARSLQVIIAEGQKNRLITVDLAELPERTAEAGTLVPAAARIGARANTPMPHDLVPVPTSTTHATVTPASKMRPATIALLATGAAGLATFAGFGLWGFHGEAQLREACSPRCDPAAVNQVSRRYLVADVGLGIGAAALGVAAYLHAMRPASTKGTQVALHLAPGAGGFTLQRGF
jgi:hypothetical protein